jgi:hypothetical protein
MDLCKFIEKDLDSPRWNWGTLSGNPNIPLEFIKNHIEKEWRWTRVSANASITVVDIENNPDLPWDWSFFARNPNLTTQFLEKNLDTFLRVCDQDDWNNIVKNPNISMDFIKLHFTMIPWNKSYISARPDLDMQFVCDHPDPPYIPGVTVKGWDWYNISQNPNISTDFIDSHLDLPWQWEYMSLFRVLPIDFIKRHQTRWGYWVGLSMLTNLYDIEQNLYLPWIWKSVSMRSDLTPKFIDEHPETPKGEWKWDWGNIACRLNMPISYLETHVEKFKEYGNELSQHVSANFVNNHRDIVWNWDYLSSNPNITMEDIELHLGDEWWKWNWDRIPRKPNLTMDFIERHFNGPSDPESVQWQLRWSEICNNHFHLDSEFKRHVEFKKRVKRQRHIRFNKILRLTRKTKFRRFKIVRFLTYHTISKLNELQDDQIAKNLIYFG